MKLFTFFRPLAAGAPVVEEGLATHFSIEQTKRHDSHGTVTPKYVRAAALVETAETIAPDFIREIRTHVPAFTEWTPELFQKEMPAIPASLVAELLAPFY